MILYRVSAGNLRSRIQRGFTLIELLVAISVLGILLTIAVPSFNDATMGGRLTSYANNFVASTRLARSEAIKRNAQVRLCVSTDGLSCGAGGWESGWIVACQSTDNTTCVNGGVNWIVFRVQPALPAGYKMTATGGVATLSFMPSGLVAPATLTTCRATPSAGRQERVINLKATGGTSVTRTATGTCL